MYKKIAIITGTSKGIGQALAKVYLENHYKVIGIARTNTMDAPNFTFIPCDLQDWERIDDLDFSISDAEEIVLINNAGRIGEIVPFQETTFADFKATMDLNLMAVMALCHKVLNLKLDGQKLTMVNISSGAGRNTIPSWTPYCTSKAAIDHFSSNLQAELEESQSSVRVYSVAPGVVDTEMQGIIREADATKFSALQKFHALHENHQLQTPAYIAKELFELVNRAPKEVLQRIEPFIS